MGIRQRTTLARGEPLLILRSIRFFAHEGDCWASLIFRYDVKRSEFGAVGVCLGAGLDTSVK